MARTHNLARLKLIADLHNELQSYKEVAKRMGISKSAVIMAKQTWVKLSTNPRLTKGVR